LFQELLGLEPEVPFVLLGMISAHFRLRWVDSLAIWRGSEDGLFLSLKIPGELK